MDSRILRLLLLRASNQNQNILRIFERSYGEDGDNDNSSDNDNGEMEEEDEEYYEEYDEYEEDEQMRIALAQKALSGLEDPSSDAGKGTAETADKESDRDRLTDRSKSIYSYYKSRQLLNSNDFNQRKTSKLLNIVPKNNPTLIEKYQAKPYCGQYSSSGEIFYSATQDSQIHIYDRYFTHSSFQPTCFNLN
jgi:hypothetical protein